MSHRDVWRWSWLCASLVACGGVSPLPAAPARRSAAELAAWQTPPSLAAEVELTSRWKVQRTALDNGLHVNVVSRPESSTTYVVLWVPSAAQYAVGPVALMTEAMRAGTVDEHGQVLVNPRLGWAPIEISTGPQGTDFAWQVLPRAGEQAVALLGRFIQEPVFDPGEVAIQLERQVSRLQRYGSSFGLQDLVAVGALPGVPATDPRKDAQRLAQLKVDDLRRLHECGVRTQRAELVIVGPMAADAAIGWARQAFGAWRRPIASAGCPAWPEAAPSVPPTSPERTVIQVLRGYLTEPRVVMVIRGPSPRSEDYPAFELLSEVLQHRDAGAPKRLRQAGLTSGIEVELTAPFPDFSLLELSGQLEESQAPRAVSDLLSDVRALAQNLDAEDLDIARRRLGARFSQALHEDDGLARTVLRELRRGHPPEAVYDWPQTLREVDLERCRQVAERWLSDAKPSIAVSSIPASRVRGLNLDADVRELHVTE